MRKEWFQSPNLLSLSRVFLTPFIGYYLALGDSRATVICIILLIVAGITDGLDGYLARRLDQVSKLGMALDPVADKVFAGVLVVLLIFYRDFPVWLAGVIIGRDLLILAAGSILLKGKELVLPSNISGKYAFGVIPFLVGSYIIRFDFGVMLMTYVTVLLLIVSTIIYARVFVTVKKGVAMSVFHDKPAYKVMRIGASMLVLAVFFYKMLVEFI